MKCSFPCPDNHTVVCMKPVGHTDPHYFSAVWMNEGDQHQRIWGCCDAHNRAALAEIRQVR